MQPKKVALVEDCCTPGCGPACGCGPSVIPTEDLLREPQTVHRKAQNALRTIRA